MSCATLRTVHISKYLSCIFNRASNSFFFIALYPPNDKHPETGFSLAAFFDDREDDQGVHLNGFWILVEETGSIEAAERALRVLFDGYIDDAMAALDILPRPCQAIVQGLIGRLYQKYPSLQKVA